MYGRGLILVIMIRITSLMTYWLLWIVLKNILIKIDSLSVVLLTNVLTACFQCSVGYWFRPCVLMRYTFVNMHHLSQETLCMLSFVKKIISILQERTKAQKYFMKNSCGWKISFEVFWKTVSSKINLKQNQNCIILVCQLH